MAVLSSMPCPVDGCAVHLRVTATATGWSSVTPDEMIVEVEVDDAGREHLASHLLVNNPDLSTPEP